MAAFSLTNKNIVITGASSGIGRACAICCSEMGANVVLIGRNNERLEQTKSLLKEGKHLIYSFDLTDFDKISAATTDMVEKNGRVSGFIHSAGIELSIPLKNTKVDHYRQLFDLNVYSGFEFARCLSHFKIASSSGASFVFISSIMGHVGEIGKTAYSSSKGAVDAGVKSMALELANKRIRVNSVLPALVETELSRNLLNQISDESKNDLLQKHPLGFGSPEDVAWTCVFLLSDEARWITGSNIKVDGGYSAR